MNQTRYRLNHGSQVREEDFGLLFYKMTGPRLYFVSSCDLISPDFFSGEMTLEEWIVKKYEDTPDKVRLSKLKDILDQLCKNEVIIEC